MYYCSLIYELCLHKGACLFISTVTSQNCSTSLEISLPYQTVYQYLLDNLVSRPLFVPTVIVVLHSSNSEHSSFMNLNTNCGSQSLITFWGIPISWKTQSQDILATFWAVMFILISIQRTILEKQSTITNILLYSTDSGNGPIKSILTISQGFCGILLG